MATSTLAPVTSSRPEDWTWITARWITRWKPAVGLESWRPSGDQIGEFAVDIIDQVAAENVEIDIAGPHDGRRILVVDQGQEKMFEGCVFVTALACESEGSVKGLFKTARKARQRLVLYETGLG